MHEHDTNELAFGRSLTDDEMASVVGGDGDPIDVEPDAKATPIIL